MNSLSHPHQARAFTLMEFLVALAIVIVLLSIAVPIALQMRSKTQKIQAVKTMGNLGAALGRYAADHDGMIPAEDIGGKDEWAAAALPAASEAWYNALPRAVQSQGVGDYVTAGNEAAFYTPASMLFLPGAHYPNGRKMARPYFAMGMNSRLNRRVKDGSKPALKLSQISEQSRTVAFFERGLPGEKRAHSTISKSNYDGSPKGTAKAFVARYSDRGVVTFVDGSARELSAKELLRDNGDIIWASEDPSMILWSPDPKVDPNVSGDK